MRALLTESRRDVRVLGIGRRPCAGRHGTVVTTDVTARPSVDAVLVDYAPTHIVHLAGETSPSAVEGAREAAHRSHLDVISHLAQRASTTGAWLLYPSTDFVWDGCGQRRWSEDDQPRPRSAYGGMKLAGEHVTLGHGGCVARFSLLHGEPVCPRSSTWVRLIGAVRAGERVNAVADEYRTPMRLSDAADVIVGLGRLRHRGIVHVAGPDVLTPFELFSAIAAELGIVPDLRVISRLDLPGVAARPRNMAMDASLLHTLLPDIELNRDTSSAPEARAS
jgi:dTDP-4-dehydrorhamnose reductase